MPTNVFNNPNFLRGSAQRNLGFDPSSMVQSMAPQIMQDVDERRQMGRGKYTEDILQQRESIEQQKLAAAAQEIQNRVAAYHYQQEQDYYNSLKSPEGQAMFKGFQERENSPYKGPLTNPNQIRDFGAMQHDVMGEASQTKRMAELILQYGMGANTPEVTWAKKVLGIPETSVTPTPAAPAGTPAASPPRSAANVFMHELTPGIGGAGGVWAGAKLGSRASPGWGTLIGAGVGGTLGYRGTDALQTPLSPEDRAAHPIAAGAGNIGSLILSLLTGAKATMGKGPGSLGGGATLPSGPPGISGFASKIGKVSGKSAATPGIKIKGQPGSFRQSLQNMFQRQPQAPAPVPQAGQPTPGLPPSMGNVPGNAPQYGQPTSGLPPSMGNVPAFPTGGAPGTMSQVPQPIGSYEGPLINDPGLQQHIMNYFKKVYNPGQNPPPVP